MLVLEDGRRFDGLSFGAEGEFIGEVVFNTALTGYQEILTDPSYSGQIMTFTMPVVGCYGTNAEDAESDRPHATGMIVREAARTASNFRSRQTLGEYLKTHNVCGIEGIDTRALVLHIRDKGSMNGIISTTEFDTEALLAKLADAPKMLGLDLAGKVTCAEPYVFEDPGAALTAPWRRGELINPAEDLAAITPADGEATRIVVVDFGVKRGILRALVRRGCRVEVVPATTSAADILARKPDGVMLSNGPGDPEPVTYGIALAKALMGEVPLVGICLGHQIIGLALGGKTFKLKFGHRGGNHPVIETATGVVAITSQNHGFAVEEESLASAPVTITHRSLNDGTVEGLRHVELPVYSVQYHPEAGPGPHDGDTIFDEFLAVIRGRSPDSVSSGAAPAG